MPKPKIQYCMTTKALREIKSLLEESLVEEECFASNPDIGKEGCFHCRADMMIFVLGQTLDQKDEETLHVINP